MSTSAVDARKIAAMRLILAVSGLLITWVDPMQPDRLSSLTYIALGAYAIYSAALYFLFLSKTDLPDFWTHWADVGWYTLLISLSDGTNSIFFFGFFLAVVSASFRWGFAAGVSTAIVSTLAFMIVGLTLNFTTVEFDLDLFLIRTTYLLVIGYMIAYWGGNEIALKKRLALLREVSNLANPRFGVERTVGLLMQRLNAFYSGALCVIVTKSEISGAFTLVRAGTSSGDPLQGQELAPDLGQMLLGLPGEQVVLFNDSVRWWERWLSRQSVMAFDRTTSERENANKELCAQLASFLGARSFVSIPVQQGPNRGRLFLGGQKHYFTEQDAQFLLQVSEQVIPILENVILVDRLASDAADAERQKIARDIHDSVIQPFIGMQMALAATREKFIAEDNKGVADLDRILDLAVMGVADLRGFVQTLNGKHERQPTLVPAMQRFIERYTRATGIAVDFVAPDKLYLNDRLAAAVFQLITEGLSNVRKHTKAERASVFLIEQREELLVRIENENKNVENSQQFTPRSIAGRAASLGGHISIEQTPGIRTAVIVVIPL